MQRSTEEGGSPAPQHGRGHPRGRSPAAAGQRAVRERRAATGSRGRSLPPPRADELAVLAPRLLAVATRVTGDATAAEDVVQNAFVKALRHLAGFRGQARLSTWMHRIAVNEALMWLRAEQRHRTRCAEAARDGLAGVAPPTRPDEAAAAAEEVAQIAGALGDLPAAEREVLQACVFGEEAYATYAARTGLHPAAAKTRAFRARRHLAERLRNGPGARIPAG